MKQAYLFLLSVWLFLMSMAARAATGPDFTTLTAAVDYSTAIAAILVVMAGLAGVYIVMSGGSMILQKLRGGR
ncbi:hypothetical protein [Propionivibrio soli]|uniref:hypothetical protein n=1 Tax=Propionivibrio soli TaxID=2976531 RepID=UPI0021E6FB19|nr:hypothetical protein [Propionivibrio soli]